MSGFPPPAHQRFQPPPPGAPKRFPMPPSARGDGSPAGGFPTPPPAKPGIATPPPPAAPMQQLNQQMGSMSMQQRSPPPAPGPPAAPMPGAPHPPAAPGMFKPPAPPGAAAPGPSLFQPPAPGQSHAPTMFQPPPPAGSMPTPPGGPAIFHPPPPGSGGPPPPGPTSPMMQPMQAPAPPQAALNMGAQSPFYQPTPSQGQMNRAMAPPGAAGAGSMPGAAPTMTNDNIDYSIKIPEHLCRMTVGMLPKTTTQAQAAKIPLGGLLRPLAPDGPEGEEVDTVQPGTAGIVRCKRCRTYINAFVTWSDHGRRWRCNICAQMNDCPSAYFCHLDEKGLRRDRFDRPELSKGVVEFIAPAEYMVRPPQEPSYFFVLDVSATAVRSGMLEHAANAIKASLDDLPGRGRTKIGFITFDNAVHYYNLASDLSSPQMLVVSDLKELFVPLPDNLLVNLQESRAVVEAFLDSLPEMFAKNPVVSQSCLGPALKAAFTVMKQIGGKMCVFQSIMPNLGDGALKPREQPRIMGTPNEIKLLRPEVTWYKDTAVEFSRQQISVDMYVFPYQYMDFASLGELPKFTAGSFHSYAFFNKERDGQRFEEQLNKGLTQMTAFESVMRIRCTKGMRITNFYGNFYIRGTDLMALPNCNTDSVFGFDLVHDEQNVTDTHVTIQAALLYTSSDGERRIRVMTQALPVTALTSEIVATIDVDATCTFLAKQALEVAFKSSLDNARMKLQQICIDMLRTAKGGDKRTVSGYSVPPPGQPGGGDSEEKPVPENLQLLPLYTLAMMKNVAFRGGTDVHPDERVQAHHLLNNMWVEASKHFIYPRMFSIHNMGDNAGYPAEETIGEDDDTLTAGRDRIVLPPVVNLSIDGLSSDGVYLLDNGVEIYLWAGRNADMNVISSLFGVHTLDDMDPGQIKVLTSGDPFANRFGAIVDALREDLDSVYSVSRKINVVREGDMQMEARFYWFLIEDRASFQGGTHSYAEFMQFVNDPNASAGTGRGPPGPPGGPMHGHPPGAPPPQQPGMGMGPPPPQQPGMGMGPPPPQQPGMGMGPPPPQQPGMGMGPPPPGQYGAPPPGRGGPPPPGGGGYGGPPAPGSGGYGGPPPPGGGGGGYGSPPPPGGGHGGPPPPPGGGYGGPPPPQHGGYGAPPPPGRSGPPGGSPAGGPPMGGYQSPPPGPPGPPRQGPPSMPPAPGRAVPGPPHGYGAPPPTNPQQPPRGMPPPPRGSAPPPPPPPPGR